MAREAREGISESLGGHRRASVPERGFKRLENAFRGSELSTSAFNRKSFQAQNGRENSTVRAVGGVGKTHPLNFSGIPHRRQAANRGVPLILKCSAFR